MEKIFKTYKITELDAELTYTAAPEKIFEFRCSDAEFRAIQGSNFDGETYYTAATAHIDGREVTKIMVMDKEGNILRESPGLFLDHANCISYSPDGNLFVTHCQSSDGHYYRYSVVNPETFEILETADLEKPFFAMAYCSKNGKFGSGQWGGQTLNVWDSSMKLLKDVDVEMPASLSQGLCCTEDGLYFVRSHKNGAPSEIRHYNWDLELVRRIVIDLYERIEVEDISIIDGEAYVVANDWDNRKGIAYKLLFQAE